MGFEGRGAVGFEGRGAVGLEGRGAVGLEGRGAPRLRRREVEDRRRRGAEGARTGRGRDCQARAGVQRPAMDGMVKQRDHRKRPARASGGADDALARVARVEVIREGDSRWYKTDRLPGDYVVTLGQMQTSWSPEFVFFQIDKMTHVPATTESALSAPLETHKSQRQNHPTGVLHAP